MAKDVFALIGVLVVLFGFGGALYVTVEFLIAFAHWRRNINRMYKWWDEHKYELEGALKKE